MPERPRCGAPKRVRINAQHRDGDGVVFHNLKINEV
jgi:hypothetical protein